MASSARDRPGPADRSSCARQGAGPTGWQAVSALARLPRRVSRSFAAIIDAGTRPFHVINYVGSLGGGHVLGHSGMERLWMS